MANYLYKSISTHRPEPTIDYTVFHSDRNATQKLDPTKVNRQQQAYFDALKALKASMNYAEHDRLSAWQEAFFNQLPNEQLDDEYCTFYQQVLDNFRDWGGTWSPHARS